MFDQLRMLERRELERLEAYLAKLDADGWIEQAYAAEWRVFNEAGHLGSSKEIFTGSFAEWLEGAPPVTQARRQQVWDKYNALAPGEVLAELRRSLGGYLERLAAFPAEAAAREVDFAGGKRTIQGMLSLWLNETLLHAWDIYVARDRSAALPADAVEVALPTLLELRTFRMPAALAGKRVQLRTPEGNWRRLIDFTGERPVVRAQSDPEAEVVIEAPAEELCRLLAGRHHVPGARPRLVQRAGTYADRLALNLYGG
jgi:uncharacterized protein (TIGR03083 family)